MKREDKQHAEFQQLCQPHLKSLQNTAFRFTKDNMEVEDLLEEALFKALKGLSSFEPNTNFRAWIFRILINTYLTHYRKKSKQPKKVSYDDMEDYSLYQKSDFDFDAEYNKAQSVKGELFEDEIQTVLDKMPYYFKLVVMLYDIEGFSYSEILKMVNIPVGTVISRLSRGRKLLRQKLKRYAKSKGYNVDSNLSISYAN
jgi:RNA polymerase sigma-70 factor (ECF subfamily)